MKASSTATGIGSIGAALLAHIPCCGPTILMAIGGAGVSLGWLDALHPYRYLFIGFSLLTLGYGFFQAYRKPHKCHTCGNCSTESHARRRANIGVMWAIFAVSVSLLIVGEINESTHNHSESAGTTLLTSGSK